MKDDIEAQLNLVMELNRRTAVEIAKLWGMVKGPVQPVPKIQLPPPAAPDPPPDHMAELLEQEEDDRIIFANLPKKVFDRGFGSVVSLLRILGPRRMTFNEVKEAWRGTGRGYSAWFGTVEHWRCWFGRTSSDTRPVYFYLTDDGRRAAKILAERGEEFLLKSVKS